MEKTYTVGEFKRLIRESSNEFQAKMGAGVERENKSNNDKSYKEANKRARNFDGGLREPEKKGVPVKQDGNKTTLDYNPDGASAEYKARIKSQAKGYTSTAEENNGIEKQDEFSDRHYKSFKKQGQEMHKNWKDIKKSGLTSRELPDETFEKEDMYENKRPKTVTFKKTAFMNEEHMKSRIPDEMKTEGTVFKMKDKNSNTYLVEWSNGEAQVLRHSDRKGLVESIDKMKHLFNYSASDYSTSRNTESKSEEAEPIFGKMLENIRKITE